jgi:fatty acid synthase
VRDSPCSCTIFALIPFFLGALSPKAVHTLAQSYKEQCLGVDPLILCDHLGRRARQMSWRTYAIADSLEVATFPDPVIVGKRPNPVIYCFSGQGPQHWQQGRDLMAMYSTFRESIYACDKVHKEYTGRSFLEDTGLFVTDIPTSSPLTKSLIWPANIISVAITFFQIAFFDLIISLGVKPVAIVGHSIGETAVLYASGAMPRDVGTFPISNSLIEDTNIVIPVQMVIKIAVARGRALAMVDNAGGSMVAISGCDADAVRDHINAASSLADISETEPKALHMAGFNSPTDIGVSGSTLLIDILTRYIDNWVDGVMARKLRVSTAVHSPFVDPCEETYRSELSTIFSQYAGPFIPSTLTMSTVIAEFKYDEYTVDYLWRNLRQPVLFSSAIPKIVDRFGETTTFVEISPHPILSQVCHGPWGSPKYLLTCPQYIKKMGAFDSLAGSMRPSTRQLKTSATPPTEVHSLLQVIGKLLACGINSVLMLLVEWPCEA